MFHSLRLAINALKDSCLNRDYFKMTKRMWSLGRIIEKTSGNKYLRKLNREMLNKIIPFVSSDVSYLNSLKNAIGVIGDLIDNKVKYFPYEAAIKQIQKVKSNIGNITIIDNKIIEQFFNPHLDELYYAV